ncbi:MAG: GtrA family protein [Rhodocyclaceae bacterium]|jgi:putative flippase GtrA|nr:GtrA family protein [Rhodocyclaceae bacterium]
MILVAKEFMRYLAVSALALAVDLGLFSFLMRVASFPWMLAATIGFIAGVGVAYWLSIRIVFRARRLAHAPGKELLAFALIGVAGLALTQLVLWVGIEQFHANPELTKLFAAGFTFLANFGLRKFVLFRRRAVVC